MRNHGRAARSTKTPRFALLAMALVAFMAMTGAAASSAADERSLYIVILADPPLATYEGGIPGLAPTAPSATGASKLDASSPASTAYRAHLAARQNASIGAVESALGRAVDVRYRYNAVLNGYAVGLDPDEAEVVRSLPGVQRVERDSTRQLLTDNGPRWIGADSVWDAPPASRSKGEGVVVGVIDTGINHDHPSFAATGPVDGYVHTNPRGRFYGACDPATGAPYCNNKLIGIHDFTGPEPPTAEDPLPIPGKDVNGHGSHTASTAAGNELNAVLAAPTLDFARNISGVAPHANIIAYKACVGATAPVGECLVSALTAAINQAALDAVDVVNFSIGGGPGDPWFDVNSQSMLSLHNAGVFIAASAGNAGPGPGTVGAPGTSPWLMTVGAATHDRKITNAVAGLAGGATTPPGDMMGAGLTTGYGSARIIYAGDAPYNSPLCGGGALAADGENSTTNPFLDANGNPRLDGEIVLCERGTYGRVAKGRNVKAGGGGGMILMNDAANGDSLVGDAHALPAVHISHANGNTLKDWLDSGSGHEGTITGFTRHEGPQFGDITASFSSRGPNAEPNVIKPDITAPGVDILAAFSDAATDSPTDFGIISGTSMSSPHAAGAAALIRDLRPGWTPDEVRAALMTTSFTTPPGSGTEVHGVLKENGSTAADPFDMGAGRVDLTLAAKAGLVLDESGADYAAADPADGGDPRTLNLPSMADNECDGSCSWTRTVRSTASGPVTWAVSTAASPGVSLTVTPSQFTIAPGETRTLTIVAGVGAAPKGQWHFGQVNLRPSLGAIPAAHLPVAVFAVGESSTLLRKTLHFHGNAGPEGADHDGHPDEGLCTGDGKSDLLACNGPWLLESEDLSLQPAASWKGGFAEWGFGGTTDRTIYDPNWVWCLTPHSGEVPGIGCDATEDPDNPPGETTLEGPMTVEFWMQCAAACIGATDWTVRLHADSVMVLEQRVTANVVASGPVQKVQATVQVPRVTANYRFTIHLEPYFTDQAAQFSVFYDSREACPGATGELPCDSIVHMPVEGLEPPPPTIDPLDHRFVADFNGDGKDEIVVWRQSNGVWHVRGDFAGVQWGRAGDIPVPADYNGDGRDEFAVWRPASGHWFIHGSFGGGGIQWGQPGDVPVPADYDGDGTDDIAVYRAGQNWHWYVRGQGSRQWGHANNIPVPGNYDADPADEIATYRTTDSTWFVEGDFPGVKLGEPGDIPVQADYDGDGRDEYAVWRPTDGTWLVRNQGITMRWGRAGDIPVPGDYDTDPADDETVWRPSNGFWFVGGDWSGVQWGQQNDVP